ncbi:DUF2855 family protein [Aquabacterium sp. A7-Y]|uniref:DUF2855 family protein n=1 Tax=Aquabacterium sp. A7-Y TaxID=1349605 RepID=UPI00223D3EF4|nr:DUF2855 family protein [Aquabacterium sp. A7-Y]MCW7537274.1 DUF2855 family protein [Aquabacterium sp. A7-Y]
MKTETTMTVTRLLTRKTDLGDTQLRTDIETAGLAEGEALLRIQRVALTTNNITYAAFGDAMQYWGFFPTSDPAFGHMPTWGFAEVVASTVQGVEAGERFYGYFPIASHLRVQPHRVTARGFYDAAEHRQGLTSAYNHYVRCSTDPVYSPGYENYQILLRPLFITSFMLADFLQDNDFFGARQLVVSSASSKTAYGTAFCLTGQPGIEMIGLTSARNQDFVDNLGCYQGTVRYEGLSALPKDKPTLYVDFSGDEALRERVHHHFGEALTYDCFAGSAQNTQFLRDTGLPGPTPIFYFAPVQIKKRNADWGHAEVNRKFNEAQLAFIRRVSEPGRPWLQVQEHRGFDAARTLVADLHAGRIDPVAGHVVVLS